MPVTISAPRSSVRPRRPSSETRVGFFPHTLGLGDEVWRVLALCHERRNRAEYEGIVDVDDQLVDDLVAAASAVEARVVELVET